MQKEQEQNYTEKVNKINAGKNLKYSILTMGCQLNENDSEKIAGMAEQMGYTKTDDISQANLIIFNTCCVRENAEDKLFGKLGEVKKYKEANGTIIAIGGCMMQEKHIVEKLKKSYPFFDIVFGTHTLHTFPKDVYEVIQNKGRIEDILDIDGEVIGINTIKISSAEGIGFAVPINLIKTIIEKLATQGKFEEASIGIFAYDKNVIPYIDKNLKFDTGIYVVQVSRGSSAYNAGLREKDIIIKIDNITLEKMSDLRKYIYTKNVGDEVILRIQRNNVEKEVKMMLTRK